MRKILFLLAFVSTLAHAQYYGGYLPLKGGTLTGALSATGNITTTGGNLIAQGPPTAPASVATTSSVQLLTGSATANQPAITFVNTTNTANNRISYEQFGGNQTTFGFANDAFTSGVAWLTSTGGFASGITGITSNSGAGAWVHTGLFTATSGVQLPITTVAALPACVSGLTGVMRAVNDFTGTPTYNGPLVGGGAVTLPVFCNGTAWLQH